MFALFKNTLARHHTNPTAQEANTPELQGEEFDISLLLNSNKEYFTALSAKDPVTSIIHSEGDECVYSVEIASKLPHARITYEEANTVDTKYGEKTVNVSQEGKLLVICKQALYKLKYSKSSISSTTTDSTAPTDDANNNSAPTDEKKVDLSSLTIDKTAVSEEPVITTTSTDDLTNLYTLTDLKAYVKDCGKVRVPSVKWRIPLHRVYSIIESTEYENELIVQTIGQKVPEKKSAAVEYAILQRKYTVESATERDAIVSIFKALQVQYWQALMEGNNY